MEKYTEQELTRRHSLQELNSLGINPYPAEEFKTNSSSDQIKKNYTEGESVVIAGRIMGRRIMGKASFVEIKDAQGKIQIYLNRDEICPEEDKTLYNTVFKKHLDIGDIIGIEGVVFKTKVGEISVKAKNIKLLSKAIKPIPIVKTDSEGNVFDAFKNTELRYRQRELDLIVNEDSWSIFKKRTKIFNSIRKQLNKKNFIEVETPILQPIAGGAAARPFITHHNTLDVPLYLRIANELYLKRLIVGGEEGVYEFAKDFRNEGMDKTHNPEFTMLELYVAYKDYKWMMTFVEELFKNILLEVCGSTVVTFNKNEISFEGPYKKLSFFDAIKNETGKDLSKKTEQELLVYCKSKNIETNSTMGRGKLLDSVFGQFCEKKLIQPTFITDYPAEMSPLTKAHRNKPGLTERFELFVDGKEIANAYSEQNNPIEQRKSFEKQAMLAEKGDDEAMLIDESFLTALEYGMPPTSGIGIGMDRLTMLLTNQNSIQDVLFFPQMKPEK
ncbi:lysine--tRNA ligase [Flavobacteriales bacterium]|nr:lysine--tRNA ligase [Flavobacteriales bacterium]